MVYHIEWPQVSSPLARGVLAAVERKQPALANLEGVELINEDQTRQGKYRSRIRRQLQRSGLALLIPGGEALVPDITAALPQPWRTLARFSRPRTHAQLALQIMRHLNWYLDPTQPAVMPFKLHKAAATLAIALLLVSWRLVPMLLDYMYEFWIPGLALAFVVLGGLFLWIATAQADGTSMDRVNRIEFYRYLCKAYHDPPEHPKLRSWERTERGQKQAQEQQAKTSAIAHS